jgi:hypothetical protein
LLSCSDMIRGQVAGCTVSNSRGKDCRGTDPVTVQDI